MGGEGNGGSGNLPDPLESKIWSVSLIEYVLTSNFTSSEISIILRFLVAHLTFEYSFNRRDVQNAADQPKKNK